MSLLIPQKDLFLTHASRALGERLITNENLIEWMGAKIRASWIENRTGIRTRYWVREDQATSDLATVALEELSKSGVSFDLVRSLVLATVSGDYSSPPTSPLLQNRFALTDCQSFDLGAACAGFITALQVAGAQTLVTGEESLIVAADIRSKYLNRADFATCVLFGDGASAAKLSLYAPREGAGYKVLGALCVSDGEYAELVQVPAGGTRLHATQNPKPEEFTIQMKDGAQVFLKAVHAMTELPFRLLETLKIERKTVRWFVPHQANLHLIKEIRNRVPEWADRVVETVSQYGNTSGSSVGIALSHLQENQELRKGDLILLASAGGGGLAACALIEKM